MTAHVSEPKGDCPVRTCQIIQEIAPIRTLVVDDSADVLEVMCALLEMEDHVEVIGRAANGSEALDAVRILKPDLVVMDVQMPGMDGLTAATLIHLLFPEVFIVLMSADPSYYSENEIRAFGADTLIDKVEFLQAFPRVLTRLTAAAQARV